MGKRVPNGYDVPDLMGGRSPKRVYSDPTLDTFCGKF